MTAQKYFKEHGITQDSIEKFGISFDEKKITFPVRDEEGNFLFNKYRYLNFDKEDANTTKFSYDKGSSSTLFNTEVLKDHKYVFLVEGEPDCIRLDQEGMAAITPTSGAGTFKEEWADLLKEKKVYVLYDNDKAGNEGAQKVLDMLPNAVQIKLPAEIKDVCEYFQTYTKNDFNKMVGEQLKKQEVTYDDLCKVVDKWLLIPDKNVLKVFVSTLISHFLTTDPLWMFFVAPPSGSKTEVISTAVGLPFVYMLSDLTANTLASGMVAKKDPSLLDQLHDNVIMMKDFTTVLNMHADVKNVILAQLREVYDGKYNKAFGTGRVFDWEGRITLIAGVTPMIDTQSSIFQVMGERFVMYRIPQPDYEEMAMKALQGSGAEKKMREELRSIMNKFFNSIDIPHVSEIEFPDEIKRALASLATFVVTARSGIVRNYHTKDLEYIPDSEAPPRLTKQLGTLIRGLAILARRKKVTWEDYYLVLRVALDVIPANRSRHIAALCEGFMHLQSTTLVAKKTNYSPKGSTLILEDLVALELVHAERQGRGQTNQWMISDKTRKYFSKILPSPTPELDKIFPKGSHYRPIITYILQRGEGQAEIELEEADDLAEMEAEWIPS